jgi:HAD superfamily hydrolase (TIGR01450 family)
MKTRLFLFDVDGTLINGARQITGAVECLNAIAALGASACILTNNSSRSRKEYREIFAGLGCDIPEENIFTAGDIAAHYIASHWPGATVYVVGTGALEEACREQDLVVTNEMARQKPEVVLVGLDQTLTYGKLAEACAHLRQGARYVATHPDRLCPEADGTMVPDIGCTLAFIKMATGMTPLVMGKPNPYILSVIMERHRVQADEIVMVGDRLSTDIALGAYGNLQTILVCSGATSLADYECSPYKATHVFAHVGELAQALQNNGKAR